VLLEAAAVSGGRSARVRLRVEPGAEGGNPARGAGPDRGMESCEPIARRARRQLLREHDRYQCRAARAGGSDADVATLLQRARRLRRARPDIDDGRRNARRPSRLSCSAMGSGDRGSTATLSIVGRAITLSGASRTIRPFAVFASDARIVSHAASPAFTCSALSVMSRTLRISPPRPSLWQIPIAPVEQCCRRRRDR